MRSTNQAPYLPIHCNTIQTCCNAVQTLLQLTSNNYTGDGQSALGSACKIAVAPAVRARTVVNNRLGHCKKLDRSYSNDSNQEVSIETCNQEKLV